MPIEITIKPEDVDTMVRDALMKASIGKLVESTVAAATKLGGYNNPIENAVREFVQSETKAMLTLKYQIKIQHAIVEALSAHLTEEWLKQRAEQFAQQIVRDIKDRY
jgi:hypothetical protein